MVDYSNNIIIKDLRQIPGVGQKIAEDLYNLGVRSVSDLKDENAETLYKKLNRIQGQDIDRCMLYVLRCAVYYASNEKHDPELLKWWNWKDRPHLDA